MLKKELMINKEKLDDWLVLNELSYAAFAKEIGFDFANLTKMIDKKLPTSKTLLQKVMQKTGLSHNVILEYEIRVDRDA